MTQEKPEVLITRRFPDIVTKPLQEAATVHQWDDASSFLMPRKEVLKMIGRLSAVINQAELKVDEELLTLGKKLRIVANVSIGADNLNPDLMAAHGVWASNTPGHFDYPVAEYAIGGIITISRRLLEGDRFVKSGLWTAFQPGLWDGDGLTNKTLGILGMGKIGSLLARLGTCLGMNVIYYSRSEKAAGYVRVSLAELLAQSDVLSVHVPYSPESHEMIGAAEFAAMKPGVLFVNTSRGKVVCEKSLVQYLLSGHIGGAVLDVFYHEPSVPEALRSMPNVLLSPHVAGGTRASRISCYQMAVANVKAVLEGSRPLNPLNRVLQSS